VDAQAKVDSLTNQKDALIRKIGVWNNMPAGESLYFQVGANANQGWKLNIGSIKTDVLNIGLGEGDDVVTNGSGSNATIDVRQITGKGNTDPTVTGMLSILDEALTYVTTERAKLGAAQNRLEFTSNSLQISSENLSASESRVRDADMGKEMMRLTQTNILQQAAISMLAQANQQPQSVLQLLQ